MRNFILILDNLDSFTYNLSHLFASVYAGDIFVKRSNQIDMQFLDLADAIVLSPGPQRASDFPMNFAILKRYYKSKPILGVCLGMQAINEFFKGKTVYAPYPVHGKVSEISHTSKNLFENLPQNIKVARYHSLVCEVNCNYFDIDAKSVEDDVVMAIKLRNYPVFGVQFHPESFLTEFGKEIIGNFLKYVQNKKL